MMPVHLSPSVVVMAKHQDSLFRQWHMLRLVPRHPQKVTAQTLRQTLRGQGFEVTERTVQRDLNELSAIFPLMADDREKPFGWSWQKDAQSFDLPGLTIPEALTLMLAEQHLSGLLPTSVVGQLKPYFDAARHRLDEEPRPRHGRSWLDKVRTVPPSQPLVAPETDPVAHQVISDALLHEKQVKIIYRKPGSKTTVEYTIHPLALVQRGTVIYLHSRIFDYPDTRILALHRIQSATLLEDDVVYPDGYQIDETIKAGVWGFGGEGIALVELIFKPGYGDHLYETPLAANQKIRTFDDGRIQVKAKVALTSQLRWWLLGFGDGVEVVAPAALREKIVSIVDGLVRTYSPLPAPAN